MAQTVDYQSWQTGATGMQAKAVPFTKAFRYTVTRSTTAGLGFMVGTDTNPYLMVRGGVTSAGWNTLNGYPGIDLGEIKIPGQSDFSLLSQQSDWSSNKLVFTNGSDNLTVWVSQLTPAVLLQQTTANNLTLFTGPVYQSIYNDKGKIPDTATIGTTSLKYVAYRQNGTIHVSTLDANQLSLPDTIDPWILVWFGNNSHFFNTEIPLYASPQGLEYKGDVPLLIQFQNKPTGIQTMAEGGIQLDFNQAPGYMSILPLYGRDILNTTDTESWGADQPIPGETLQKIDWWNDHLCQFPTSVSETYAQNNDTTSITESFQYLTVCSSSNKTFAPIPPMLGIAKDAMGITFSGTVTDTNLATEFGPVTGIENTGSYTWSVQNLNTYVNSQKILLNKKQPDPALTNELSGEVQKVLDAGRLAPWLYADAIPRHYYRGWIYFLNPADIVTALLNILPAVSEPQKSQLTQYIETNYILNPTASYNVATSYQVPLQGDTERTGFALPNSTYTSIWLQLGSTDIFDKQYPLYNLYALAHFYDYKNQPIPASVQPLANTAAVNEFSEQNWATMYWFDGFENKLFAPDNINRRFAGTLGYAKLSQNNENKDMAMGLLAKSAVLKAGALLYYPYLEKYHMYSLPASPDWQVKYLAAFSAHDWRGKVFNYDWTSAADDQRQILTMDQFEIVPGDSSAYKKGLDSGNYRGGWTTLTSTRSMGYPNITPELIRFMDTVASGQSRVYLQKMEDNFTKWYMPFSEALFGAEHNMNHPEDSYQLFMAKAWLEKDTVQPEELARYASTPWLETGDLFYINKLAETIKAYRGWCWSVDGTTCDDGSVITPTPTTPGDTDGDSDVDIFDYNAVITDFGKTGPQGFSVADFDDDGDVDIFDYNVVISNFGQ